MAVGGLDDQRVAGDGLERLVGGAGVGLDVAGVEQTLTSCLRHHQSLRRTQAVTRRVQGDGVGGCLQCFAVRQHDWVGVLQVVPKQQKGVGGDHWTAVPPGMVGVGVGYDAGIPLAAGIEPQVECGDIHAAIEHHLHFVLLLPATS